jgi:hypothetical protein
MPSPRAAVYSVRAIASSALIPDPNRAMLPRCSAKAPVPQAPRTGRPSAIIARDPDGKAEGVAEVAQPALDFGVRQVIRDISGSDGANGAATSQSGS